MKKSLDWLLSDFRWYRRLIGGVWYYITIKPILGFYLDKKPPKSTLEIVIKTEDYSA